MMRRVLVDRVRRRHALKRAEDEQCLLLDEARAMLVENTVDLVALDEALKTLEGIDRQQSRVVELRYFGGLSIDETAAVLGISAATVKREWMVAKTWLRHEITGGDRL
jgi:RNA polymerase sigma-70 factor (ECF subfamily)